MKKHKTEEVKTTTFEMNENETAAAQAFCKEHLKHARHMSAGEAFQFIFMPTMLGTCVSVRCLSCGEIINVTDPEKF